MADYQRRSTERVDYNRGCSLYNVSNMVAERGGVQTAPDRLSPSRLQSISKPASVFTPLQIAQMYCTREPNPAFIGMVQSTEEEASTAASSGLTVAQQVASIDANFYQKSSASSAAPRGSSPIRPAGVSGVGESQ